MSTHESNVAAIDATRDIFISYRSSDDHLVRPVVTGLERAGLSCWFAPNDLHVFDSHLSQKIRAGIRTSRATLAFISNEYRASNACKWEVIESVSHGGLGSLLHVAMPGASVEWSAVQENVFAVLPTTDAEIADVADRVRDHLATAPLTRSTPHARDAWWETRWTGRSATGMFSQRLDLLSMLTEHLGRDGSDTGKPEVAQIVGFGGTGKSMLALQFARDFEQLFDGGIVRINAGADARGRDLDDRVDTVQDILRQVIRWIEHWQIQHGALQRKAPRPQDVDAWVRARSCLAEILERSGDRGLLWIIDDLPDGLTSEELERICCPSPGHTLITTRTEAYTSVLTKAATLPLHGMDRDDAVLLLSNGDGQLLGGSSGLLGQIADEVGCHALTLAVLAPMVGANGPSRTLARIRQPHPQAAEYLERAAAGGMVLPTGHESTILGTLSASILGVKDPDARTILRLASLWPKGQQMGRSMLDQVVGDATDHACRELSELRRLATTDVDGSVTVHAMVSTVTGWLVADSALQPNGGEPNEVDLRLAAATHQGAVLPELTPADVWRESDAGQVVWHLLEQISETLDDEHRELAARALLAMARLPMRHKPAGLTQEELAEILTTADGWAEQALRLHQNMSSATSGADKAAAMRGLLRLDLAEIRSGQEAIDECEAGTEQLRDVVALRQEAAHVNASAASRENLAKAHFNLGRLVKVAKKLEENGANAGVGEALDDAHTSYLAAARIRENLIAEGGGEGRAPRAQLEDLASSYRGMAIVALTRVCRQDGLTLDRCRDSLSEALKHLTEARRLTCTALRTDVATSNSVASVEMCKDLGVVANVQLCRWLLRDSGREHASNDGKASDNAMRHTAPPSDDTLEARILELRWREAERTVADAVESAVALEIAGDSVPWPAMDSGEPTEPLAAARLALARLTVNHERGGKHIPGSAVLAQFRSDDLPALLRRRASGIMAL